MIELVENETILKVLRPHWYAFAKPMSVFVIFMVAPSLILIFVPSVFPTLPLADAANNPVLKFSIALYVMTLVTSLLVVWLMRYLTVWVITNRRIIDMRQRGLFSREVSEISIDRIENVSVEVPGFIATVLGFGNLKVQTAGESDFTIGEIMEYDEAREIILKCSEERTGRNLRARLSTVGQGEAR